MRAHRIKVGFVCGLAAAAAVAAALAQAQAPQASAKKRELTQVQKDLEAARREVEEYKRQEQQLGQDLQKIQSRTGQSRRRLEELQRHVADAERRKSELKARLVSLGQAKSYWHDALAGDFRRHVWILTSRDEHYGSSDLWREAFTRAAILEKVDLLLGLQGVSRQTALAEAQTRAKAQELAQRRSQAQKEHASRQQEYEAKKAAIAETQEKAAAAAARAKDLEESARALTRLIRRLREPRHSAQAQAAAHWDVPPNSLLWPAQGSVLKPFGRQKNPELDTWVINQGILLKTAAGAAVEAVRGGKVIFSGPFRSYGQVLIVDHGSGLFGIYGDLGAILKEKGAQVQPGEVIAKAGAGSPDSAGRLYFELRRGTEALDPLAWLKKQ